MISQSLPDKAPRVLVVDDNEDAADSLATLLGVMGYEVRIAYDGPEAIQTADEFEPAVALLDIGLPKLSGYDIARHVRARRGGEVLLVAITGWGQEEDRRKAREAGFDHHFTKPADFDRLLELKPGHFDLNGALADLNIQEGQRISAVREIVDLFNQRVRHSQLVLSIPARITLCNHSDQVQRRYSANRGVGLPPLFHSSIQLCEHFLFRQLAENAHPL